MLVVRAALFNLMFIGGTAVMAVLFAPAILVPGIAVFWAARIWYIWTAFWLRHLVGVSIEIRGVVPPGPCIIAAKHQSAWDTIVFFQLLDRPCYVLKRELVWIPFIGWFIIRMQHIAVNRAGGAGALKEMVRKGRMARDAGRRLVVFPEGTRVGPDVTGTYHPGIAALYKDLNLPVVPVALNSGLVWGRQQFIKRPGRIILEFLEPIAPGLDRKTFMRTLQDRIEPASRGLVAEARGVNPPTDDQPTDA